MKENTIAKTNAIRLLESSGIAVEIFSYPVDDGRIDAMAIAEKLGVPADSMFKTLVTQGNSGEYYVFVVPATGELDLRKAAKVAGEKSIEMILSKKLLPLTGYIHGGCSPVGMKKLFRTWIDETAILFDMIYVSGGAIGTSIKIAPESLAGVVSADFADIVKPHVGLRK